VTDVPSHQHISTDRDMSLKKYFTRDPLFLIKVNQTAPSILKYIFDIQNSLQWFILINRTKGKVEDIRSYKNICKGQRCFIVGNGPSVNKTNFNIIKNEIIFGTNRLYQAINQLGINCSYYVTSNRSIVSEDFDALCHLDIPIFLGQHGAEAYGQKMIETKHEFKHMPIIFHYKRRLMWDGAEMSTDLQKGSSDGDTVVMEGLQIAYYMGFKKVYLIGCDCDFSVQGHFYNESPELYRDEMMTCISRWFESYKMCKQAYEADGREIINATVGGKLEVFRRQSLDEIMKTKKINKENHIGTTHE
jgi:hypothetical protein